VGDVPLSRIIGRTLIHLRLARKCLGAAGLSVEWLETAALKKACIEMEM
jgi:hypothetical protein